MGSKYTTQSASGFNSSPPPDDGSQNASNLITWSGIKNKLADPTKNLADAINTALVSAFDYSVRQISSSDSTVASDHMKTVEIAPNVSSAITLSLGDAATMTNNYRLFVKNSSARNQTLGRATSGDTIDGSASDLTIPPGAGVMVQTNSAATGYLTAGRNAPFLDSDALVTGSSDGTKKVRIEVDGLTAGTTRVITAPDRNITLGDLSPITASLGADVALNNTANYFDGPSVAQGTSGTWFASGTVVLTDGNGAANFSVKLWDGTTVIASTRMQSSATGSSPMSVSISGYITSPAGNIRISVKDETSTGGTIRFNSSGNSKDSTITAFRIG